MPTAEDSSVSYARIALPIPVRTLFTYSIPGELRSGIAVGLRALVPFGQRLLSGFVVELTDDPGDVTPGRIKPIHDLIDDESVFDTPMLAFCEWIADYYLSSLGEVLKTAMPHGTMIRSRLMVRAAEFMDLDGDGGLTPLQERVLDAVRAHDGIAIRTIQKEFAESVSGVVRALEAKGLVTVEREISTPSVRRKTERHVFAGNRPIGEIPSRASAQLRCRELLDDRPEGVPLAELIERYSVSRGVVNALVDGGFARYEEVGVTRRSVLLDQDHMDVLFPLTGEQQRCLRLITTETEGALARPILLRGVTGSGKTRIYLELVRDAIEQGHGAIILVPEIALTPQTTRFFTSAFPGKVAVLHSALSPGERFDMWWSVHQGTLPIVIGPRSALFAPVRDLGIIIVDEEHDGSYKQDDTAPRYHARDAAVVRGRIGNVPVMLGSATPSIESWHNVKTGKYALAELTERIDARPLPDVVVVDMHEERAAGNRSSLSRRLRDELAHRIERGEKSIVLINRRGFATSIRCRSCGYVLTCPDCSIGLTWHAARSLAVCHLCGHHQVVLEHCPECGETELAYRGMGTQKIERELSDITGADGIVRMDSDTTRSHDGHYRLLEEFRTGSVPVLLGTQMVAKGLDIHEVTLVGIVSADQALFLPDFRAFERTFQLVTQVAGRAGRGTTPGLVILQTFNPDNHAIAAAVTHDFPAFAEAEIATREELAFPPFSRLILIETAARDKSAAEGTADGIARYLTEHLPESVEILGPTEAPVARRKGKHRMHILVKAKNPHPLKPFIAEVVETFATAEVDTVIDVDPLDLM